MQSLNEDMIEIPLHLRLCWPKHPAFGTRTLLPSRHKDPLFLIGFIKARYIITDDLSEEGPTHQKHLANAFDVLIGPTLDHR